MSYSCLDNDDMISLDTINLCLEEENNELTSNQIYAIDLLNGFLNYFDDFRGNVTQSQGYFLPGKYTNEINSALYLNAAARNIPEPLEVYRLLDEFYDLVMANISLFNTTSTQLYITIKEIYNLLEERYEPKVIELKGEYGTINYPSTTNIVNVVTSQSGIEEDMIFRGPTELNADISVFEDLPTVVEILTDQVELSEATTTNFGDSVLFQWAALKKSKDYIDPCKQELHNLIYYFESGNITDSLILFNLTIGLKDNNRIWYIEDLNNETVFEQTELIFIQGLTYRFKQDDITNVENPFRFTTDPLVWPAPSEYTDGVTIVGTPGSPGSYIEITITENTPTPLYYYNTNVVPASTTLNKGMYNEIKILYKETI